MRSKLSAGDRLRQIVARARGAGASVARATNRSAPSLIVLVGLGAVGVGVWQFSPRVSFIVCGTIALVFGGALERGRTRASRPTAGDDWTSAT